MAEPQKCSRCGAELPPDAPGGHCIGCLLQLGMAATAGPGQDEPSPATASSEQAGDRIGRYKLLEQIGEGGCGVVYMAEQEEPVRRRVALKIIKLGMDTRQVVARFEAERQALALMDHPCIAQVFDAGATATGRPYFVMELVVGVPITKYCDQKRFSTEQRLRLFMQVCQAIQHAHQKGVIHRDIKPSNILVTERDGLPVPKVIDFGIAKATGQQQLTDKTVFTAFDQFIGTPAYMSPEQAGLGKLDVDTRSDIYALGVLLYELLTGQPPFDAAELKRAAMDEVLRVIREKEPAKPSTRLTSLARQQLTAVAERRQCDPEKLAGQLRGDLDWIVMKALEKERARRYDTANGLAMDLQRCLSDEPILARPPARYYRLKKLVRRNRLVFAVASLGMFSLLAGLGTVSWLLLKAQKERYRAELAEQSARTEGAKSREEAQILQDMFKGVAPAVALGRDTTLLKEILDRTVVRIDGTQTNQPQVAFELRRAIGDAYYQLGLYPEAERLARQNLSLAHLTFGDASREAAGAHAQLGHAAARLGNTAQAESELRLALALYRKFAKGDELTLATVLNNLSLVLLMQNKTDEAEVMVRESLAIKQRLEGHDNEDVAVGLVNFGQVLLRDGKTAEAEQTVREGLAISRKVLGTKHPRTTLALVMLSQILKGQNKLAEAEECLREALAIDRQIKGPRHPEVVVYLLYLGQTLTDEGKLVEAEAVLREGLELADHTTGGETLWLRCSLATVLKLQQKLQEAESLAAQAVEFARKQQPEITALPTALTRLSQVLRTEEKLQAAETAAREALTIERKLSPARGDIWESTVEVLQDVLWRQGRREQAEQLVAELISAAGTNASSRAPMLLVRAELSARAGRWQEAAAELATAIDLGGQDQSAHCALAVVLAQADQLERSRAECAGLAARFAAVKAPFAAAELAETVLVLGAAGADTNTLRTWVEQTTCVDPSHVEFPHIQFIRGLAAYRLSRPDQAAELAQHALITKHSSPPQQIEALALLAMSRYQMGLQDLAQEAYAKALSLRAAASANDQPGPDWTGWALAQALLRQAEALVDRSAAR